MADWIRSPDNKWFMNSRWVAYAFESAKNNSTQWNTYYGAYGTRFNTAGLRDSSNPNYKRGSVSSSCTICDFVGRCGWTPVLEDIVCRMADQQCKNETCVDNNGNPTGCWAECFNWECDNFGSGYPADWYSSGCNSPDFELPCDMECPTLPPEDCQIALCNYTCSSPPLDECQYCVGRDGNLVPCVLIDDSVPGVIVKTPNPEAVCNPCNGGCEGITACPCGPEGCFLSMGDNCPPTCCVPGEYECCPCGDYWAPCGMCCDPTVEDCGSCSPYGYPAPASYCRSCEHCNNDPTQPQCSSDPTPDTPHGCCLCDINDTWYDCNIEDYCIPPECDDFSSNCYACGDKRIPIWFDCEEVDPCANPYDPDCNQTGDPIVCYEYNTNDPIYYNASNLGATVIIEYENPVTGGSGYSYGNVATLCEVPDQLQLCVFLKTSGGAETKLTFETDYTLANEKVILNSSVNTSGFTKLLLKRCTDDSKMFVTFKDGAKLSADDVNASMHQLLFLIQEKEFAANAYTQVLNAATTKASIDFFLDSTKIKSTALNALNTDGVYAAGLDESISFAIPAAQGGQGTTTITLDKDKGTNASGAANTIVIGTIGAASATALTCAAGTAAHGLTEKQHLTLTSTDGTAKRYVITDTANGGVATSTVLSDSGNTDTGTGTAGAAEDGGIAVGLNLSSATQHDVLTQFKVAIEHANGHNGKITVAAVPSTGGGGLSVALTQATAGLDGNKTVTEDLASTINCANFSGGGLTDTAVRDLLVKAINGTLDGVIKDATSGNGTDGIQGVTASASSTTQINLEMDRAGTIGNITSALAEADGTTGDELVAVTAFTGGKDFTSTEFDAFTFQLSAYETSGVTTKTYVFDDDNDGATGTLDGSGQVRIQLHNLASMAELSTAIEAAIAHSNGHGTKLTTQRATFDPYGNSDVTYNRLVVKQSVAGVAGNLQNLTHSAELNARMNANGAGQANTAWNFTGGQDNDASDPIITFDPPTSLPVNFDLSAVQVNSVLSWDGTGGFIGASPTQIVQQVPVGNHSDISLGTVSTGDFLLFDGTNWTDRNLETEVKAITNVFDFTNWVSYSLGSDSTLDNYYLSDCDGLIQTEWTNAGTCITNLDKKLVPNAITSFGIGYYAAAAQIKAQTIDATSDLVTKITEQVNSVTSGGAIHASLRWELSRAEGRSGTGLTAYPLSYFDIRDFDYLDHAEGTSSAGELDGDNTPNSTTTNTAYYRNWGGITGDSNNTHKNKLFINNIKSFVFDPEKSRCSGFGPHCIDTNCDGNILTGTPQNKPSEDRYLNSIRRVINKTDWDTALNYGYASSHPLKDYPNATNSGSTPPVKSYLDFTNELIYPMYTYNTLKQTDKEASGSTSETTNGWVWKSTKNVPLVVTYYLSHLWGNGVGAAEPSLLQWDGNIDALGDMDAMTDNTNPYNSSTHGGVTYATKTQETFLGATGNNWFYWKWLILGKDTDTSGSANDSTKYDELSHFNPFNKAHLALDSDNKYSLLPADGEDASGFSATKEASRDSAYSYLVPANQVFSNLANVLPDLKDEYVFSVRFRTPKVSTLDCPDASCYQVRAVIEKFIDGSASSGDTRSTKVGSAASENNGHHIYPEDFDANVVKVWESYPYEDLDIEIRSKTGDGFDLVLRVPRLKRIGVIDLYADEFDGPDFDYRHQALSWLADYVATDFDGAATVRQPDGTSDTANDPAQLQALKTDSIAAVSVETAIQFVRLGIPSSVRVEFSVTDTPQKRVFST